MIIEPLIIEYDEEIVNEQQLNIVEGGITVIKGESGSGKSSVLSYIYCDFPNKPKIYFSNNCFDGNTDIQIVKRKLVTYIKQSKEVVEDLTCIDNIQFFARLADQDIDREGIDNILKIVKLDITPSSYPSNLSGGERGKLALAIALARNTPIILCDEITASLDEKNVNIIIEILKDIAYNHQKTIICTTHSKDIELVGDCVYELENRKLKKVRYTSKLLSEESILDGNVKPISFLEALKSIFKRHNKNWITYFIYIIILSLTTSSLCVGLQYGRQYRDAIQTLNQYSVPNEYYLTRINSTNFEGFLYFDRYFGIPQNELEQIKAVLADIPSYPYYHFSIFASGEHKNEYYCDLYKEGELYRNEDKFGQQLGNREINIFPFFLEQNYDLLCSSVDSSKKEGVYISQDMANMLGINDVSKDYILKMNVGVPTSSVRSVVSTNTGVTEEVNKNNLTMYEIQVPIRGILNASVNMIFGSVNIYMDYMVMENIRKQLNDSHLLPANSTEFQPATYITFTKKDSDVISLQQQFNQIDDQLVYKSIMNLVESSSLEDVQNEIIIKNFIWIAIIVFAILMYGYGFIHRKGEWSFYEHLVNFGVSKKERFKYILSYIFIDIVLIFLLSSSILIGLLYFLQRSKILLTIVNYTNLIGKNSIIILLGVVIINIPLIKKVLSYD